MSRAPGGLRPCRWELMEELAHTAAQPARARPASRLGRDLQQRCAHGALPHCTPRPAPGMFYNQLPFLCILHCLFSVFATLYRRPRAAGSSGEAKRDRGKVDAAATGTPCRPYHVLLKLFLNSNAQHRRLVLRQRFDAALCRLRSLAQKGQPGKKPRRCLKTPQR
jgi:hypothetical protein